MTQQLMNPTGAVLDGSAIVAVREALRGDLILPGDAAYDDARRVWNGMIDRRPAAIARCTGVADVIAAVTFAREQDLPIAIRGGGHNVAGTAVNDDGLVIDLSPMKGIRVDPEARIARVEPGVTWGELDRETQVFGLATPGGEVSVTGVAGLTLGGGMGFLRRKHGLSCDSLKSVDLVTAEGQCLTASADEHAELFWGIRGGGGNLGVVTSFAFHLHPVGPALYEANVWYPLEQGREILRGWRDYAERSPDEVSSYALVWSMPAIPDLPVELHGQPVLIVGSIYAGDIADGERVLAPLRQLGTPVLDLSMPTTYHAVQTGFDPFLPDGIRAYWKSVYLDSLEDAAIEVVLNAAADRPSPMPLLVIRHLGGAIGRIGAEETAYPHREAQYIASFDACWTERDRDDDHITWAREGWAALQPHATGGQYLNFTSAGDDESPARAAHGTNFERLAALKAHYDPRNLFRSRLNVQTG